MDVLTNYEPKRYIPKHKKPELELQKQVCTYMRLQWPQAIYRSDFASGMHLSEYQAKLHASLQSGKGWPDLLIYNKKRGYSGLAIEIKTEGTRIYNTTGPRKGKLSSDLHIQQQAAVLIKLTNEGWFCRFGVGFDNIQKLIDWYFGKPLNLSLFDEPSS